MNGFTLGQHGGFELLSQGFSPTSISEGDVRLGYERALKELLVQRVEISTDAKTFVNSSAAGGLRMTVHGLTYNMTTRAAREAALGAGAIIKMVTAGLLDETALVEIRNIDPNIILLAGGVDFGEKETVIKNARLLASLDLKAPVVFAGNAALRNQIQEVFSQHGIEFLLAENVFPEVDVLNTLPLRKVIHEVFNKHIIHAPGMQHLSEMTSGRIIPTPGAVLLAAELFAEACGDCLVFDVGGATTDVHSVTGGTPEWITRQLEPEPFAKRTVEGDLGVFINARNTLDLDKDLIDPEELSELKPIPDSSSEKSLTRRLCSIAVETSIRRHAGIVMDTYTPTGRKQSVRGKDLSAVKWVVGTGGALTRIEGGREILSRICTGPGKYLFPPGDAKILIDKDYRFSALGTLASEYPEQVRTTFRNWVLEEE